MNKSTTLILLALATIAAHGCTVDDIETISKDRSNSGLLEQSLREAYDTTLIRNVSDAYYCGSHLLETKMTVRQDISAENNTAFFNVDIDIELNGKKVSLTEIEEAINLSQYPNDVALQYFCVNDQITISVFLDRGTATPYDTLIDRIHIDTDTGNILAEARKSPRSN